MMVQNLMYALRKGIRSSRSVEHACYEDVAMRFLSSHQQPDHRTITGKPKVRNSRELEEPFKSSFVCKSPGLLRLTHEGRLSPCNPVPAGVSDGAGDRDMLAVSHEPGGVGGGFWRR